MPTPTHASNPYTVVSPAYKGFASERIKLSPAPGKQPTYTLDRLLNSAYRSGRELNHQWSAIPEKDRDTPQAERLYLQNEVNGNLSIALEAGFVQTAVRLADQQRHIDALAKEVKALKQGGLNVQA